MGAFVPCATILPPVGQTVMVRFGNTICFASCGKWSRGWFMVTPGGEEKIADPPEWWSADATSVDEDARPLSPEGHAMRRSHAMKQLDLFIGHPTAKRCPESAGACGGAARREA